MSSVQRIGPLFWYEFPAVALGIYRSPRALRAAEAATQVSPSPEALIDGPMFGGPHCSGPANVCFSLYDRKQGLHELSELPRGGMLFAVKDGKAAVASTGAIPSGVDVAVQLYPSLVRGGRSVASRSNDTERTWRAALVLLDENTLAFAIGQSLSMYEFAERLVAAGAREAGYTDGGLSTTLWTPEGAFGAANARAVPSFLVAYPKKFPWVPVLTGIGAALAALATWWFAGRTINRRKRRRLR